MDFISSLRNEKITLSVGSFEILRLGDFFQLYRYKDELRKAIKEADRVKFKEIVKKTIELETKHEIQLTSLANALTDALRIYAANIMDTEAAVLNPPKKVEDATKKKQPKPTGKPSWEYEGRDLAVWVNAFAETYGWSLEEILNLPVNAAVYLYQEIALNKQFEREWQYNMSELAYQYDEATQKSKYVPLPRPDWIDDGTGNGKPDDIIRVTMLRKDMLPQGIVIDMSGMGIMSANEQNPKPIQNKGEFIS